MTTGMEPSCERVQERLPAFAAGELGPDEHRAVEAHLFRCPACKKANAGWLAAEAGLRSNPPKAPAEIWGRIEAGLGRPAVRRRTALRWAAAAALLFGAAVGVVALTDFGDESAEPLAIRFVDEPATGPREIFYVLGEHSKAGGAPGFSPDWLVAFGGGR